MNINEGSNKELLEQCQILKEYAIYVARVRKYAKYMQLETAVQKAVDECVREGILEEFLREKRAEVIAVSIFEYDKEEEERKLRLAEFEAGEQRGLEKGIQKGIQANIKTCKKFNVSKSETVKNIVKEFSLPEEKALDYVEKYW